MNTERKLYQWDTGQKLVGCTGLYVDFPIDNEVYRVETADGMCIIPDELLQTSGGHKVYECMTNNTIRSFAFSVTPRPKPPDYVYTPTERLTFEGLVQKVDDAVADMIRRAESGEFDGHTPIKGTDYFTTEEIQQIQNEVSSGAIGEFKSVVETETETFNNNAETKLNAYNQNDSQKTTVYNTNATEKLNAYNTNANNRVAEFNTQTGQIQTDISELKSDLADSQVCRNIDFSDATSGFVSYNGAMTQHSDYYHTSAFPVQKGETIRVHAKGYQTSVAMISRYENGVYIPLVNSTSSDVSDYSYTANEDFNAVVSYGKNFEHSAVVYLKVKKYMDDSLEPFRTINTERSVEFGNPIDGFVNAVGNIQTNGNFKHSNAINVYVGDTITYNGRGYSNAVAMIAKYNGEGRSHTPLVMSIDSTPRNYVYTATEDMQIVLSNNFIFETPTIVIRNNIRDYVNANCNELSKKIDNSSLNLFSIFETFGACGDSLISGFIEVASGNISDAVTNYNLSWAKQIANICGNEYTHYSYGGCTSKSWLTSFRNSVEFKDAYFLVLGTNDYATLQLGTSADIGTSADTFYRYYSEIISVLKSKNPNAKIFVGSIYRNEDDRPQWNNAIKYFADNNSNVYYLDFTNMTNKYGAYKNGSHFTAMGYRLIAKDVIKMIDAIILDNWTDFRYVGTYS